MECSKVTAIIRTEALDEVEDRLERIGVRGLTVTHVVGRGEYADLFNPDRRVAHARVEIFTEKKRVDGIVAAIVDAAHTGLPGDGIVAVTPVERVVRCRTCVECSEGEL